MKLLLDLTFFCSIKTLDLRICLFRYENVEHSLQLGLVVQ